VVGVTCPVTAVAHNLHRLRYILYC
jgi:hypothetical protein